MRLAAEGNAVARGRSRLLSLRPPLQCPCPDARLDPQQSLVSLLSLGFHSDWRVNAGTDGVRTRLPPPDLAD